MRRAFPAILLLTCCSGQGWQGDPAIHGFALDIELTQGNSDWVLHDDLKRRIRSVVELSASYWNAPPDVVSGWRLELTEGLLACSDCFTANGCTSSDDKTVRIASNYFVCIESTPLMHEIGHIVLGDAGHTDPRWHDDAAIHELWDRMHADLPQSPDCGGEPYHGQWEGF